MPVQLGITDMCAIARSVAFPDDRSLLRTLRQMAIDAVVADVEACTDEPADVTALHVGFVYPGPWRVPGQELSRLPVPEPIGIADRFLIQPAIISGIEMSVCTDLFGNRVLGNFQHASVLHSPGSGHGNHNAICGERHEARSAPGDQVSMLIVTLSIRRVLPSQAATRITSLVSEREAGSRVLAQRIEK